ncbi:MAG: laccase domain-containing protein, partial [Roseburia sp.]|nr:laccase domain-containing protein [Roseburia sp.]
MVEHCFTTRLGGVSEGMFSSMNLSFSRGDKKEAVEENFRRLAAAMGTKLENFVFTDQTHTTNVRKVTREDAGKGITKERDYSDVDGLITDEPG